MNSVNERLIAFLQAEQLSSARFADVMKIQRSGVSHLLSGRNKPGYDFFEKFLQKFPAVNIEWLISGHGKMYKEQTKPVIPAPPVVKQQPKLEELDLFSSHNRPQAPISTSPPVPPPSPSLPDAPSSPPPSTPSPSSPSSSTTDRHIEKLIILYSDGTFEERG